MSRVSEDALADRRAVEDVLATYCVCLDEYDIDGVAATFTEDCVTDYGPGKGGTVQGRTALRDRIARSQAAFARTHHQLGQILVTVDGDGAEALSYVTAWHERHDGSRDTLRLRYVDRLARTADGWRIARREIVVSAVEGFEGVEWRWVKRRPPQV